jgi:hypothetical protein
MASSRNIFFSTIEVSMFLLRYEYLKMAMGRESSWFNSFSKNDLKGKYVFSSSCKLQEEIRRKKEKVKMLNFICQNYISK